MSSILYMVLCYLRHHRTKTVAMVVGIALVLFLPLSLGYLVSAFEQQLLARAKATPLALVSRGNRIDLVLQALYFRQGHQLPVPYRLTTQACDGLDVQAIPIHVGFTTHKHPLVGTSYDYYAFRSLEIEQGRLPGFMGEVVLGSQVASDTALTLGDTLVTDQNNMYDLSENLPVRLRIVGILKPCGTADDHAVFTDLRTTWIAEGLGHGHQELSSDSSSQYVLEKNDDNVVANAAVVPYVEITAENAARFHFHGSQDEFPVSAIILVPATQKAKTILVARYHNDRLYQILSPFDEMSDLMHIVLRIKTFFDTHTALVCVSTGLFLALIMLLSSQMRAAEYCTLHAIGASRRLQCWLVVLELLLIVVMSGLLTAVLAWLMQHVAPDLLNLL
jgi:putative ABC transport system permease protein